VNRDVGAISDPIDDADFDEPIYVDELWAQQSLLGGRLRIRAGERGRSRTTRIELSSQRPPWRAAML
jgi:hypothetical protein